MATTIHRHSGVEAVFAWNLQRVTQQRMYPGRNSRLFSKACDPFHLRGNTGHGCDLGAKLLRPKECAAAEAAAHVEHLSAESMLRLPNLGGVMKHVFLRGYYPL